MTGNNAGVSLHGNKSASEVFYEVLSKAVQQFDCWQDMQWPTQQGFKKHYVDLLPEFEARRLSSSQRFEIARYLAHEMQQNLNLGEESLEAALVASTVQAVPLVEVVGQGIPAWQPTFSYLGKDWADFSQLGVALQNRRLISPAAADSLTWLQTQQLTPGALSLANRKVCVLGAGAEMAATELFLRAGARVLWLDRVAPPQHLQEGQGFAGSLYYPEENLDLLESPEAMLASMVAFADGEPMDLCLYAYAPGQAREVRLTGVMCGFVNTLPRDLIASVTMLVSPTTPAALQAEDLAQMAQRYENRPGWEVALEKLGLLGRGGGCAKHADAATIRSLVSIQGASYQAAQYLGKLMMAEAWANHGQLNSATAEPLRVSANTAAITQTKSLDHPVFDAAFGGAAALQVETFSPAQSQCLNGLLAISDWLQEDLPVPGAVRIHGGIHTLPYPLEAALKPAAGIGFIRAPVLLLGLLKGGR
jgi:hypothetical protein